MYTYGHVFYVVGFAISVFIVLRMSYSIFIYARMDNSTPQTEIAQHQNLIVGEMILVLIATTMLCSAFWFQLAGQSELYELLPTLVQVEISTTSTPHP